MSNGNFNPGDSKGEVADNGNPASSTQGSPNPIKPANPEDKPTNHKKARLFIRIWRSHRKRQQRVSPPNVAEKITVFLILVTAAIGGIQARIYYQQKKIMESSSHQTDQLIEAADMQARAARRNAVASRREAHAADRNAEAAEAFAASAEGINRHTDQAVSKLKLQADETKVTNDQAKKAMNVQSRPWVGISNVALEGDGDRVRLNISHVHMVVRNYGSSPAIRLIHKFFYFRDTGEWGSSFQDMCAQLNDTEQRVNAPSFNIATDTVFPGDGLERSFRDTPTRVNLDTGDVFLIVCLSYQTTFDQDWHHTRALYEGRSPTFVGQSGNPSDPYGKATMVSIEMKPQNVQAD